MSDVVRLEDIREASARIRPIARITPVMASHSLDSAAGVEACLKCENLQRGGSFKIRGAANFILQIPEADRPRGVVAFSSGNHAQAVAIAARHLRIPATLVMPTDAPRSKVAATRAQGATIVTYDRLRESREAIGVRIAQESGATLVPPFDHPRTIAGQGTAALELLEQVPDLDALIAPVGGGGLLSGCAIAAKSINPAIRIFGAEPEDAKDTFLSFRAGQRVEIPPPQTLADGLRATRPGEVTFPILQELAEDILLVSEEEIRGAVKFLLMRTKILVEPSGAVAAAAVLTGRPPQGVRRMGVILSGGNVDWEVLVSL